MRYRHLLTIERTKAIGTNLLSQEVLDCWNKIIYQRRETVNKIVCVFQNGNIFQYTAEQAKNSFCLLETQVVNAYTILLCPYLPMAKNGKSKWKFVVSY